MEDIRNEIKPGMIVRVHQKIKDVNAKGEEKLRTQIFEGMVLAVKHGKQAGATFTVRKVSKGIAVEKIYPTHSPVVEKVELVREMQVRRSRPYYLRNHKKKLKEIRRPAADKPKAKAKAEPEPKAKKEKPTEMK